MINLGNGKYRPLEEIEEAFEKAERLDSVLGSPYKITYHGAGKYTSVAVLNHEHLRQLLEKEKKWDLLNDPEGKAFIQSVINMEKENKQLEEELESLHTQYEGFRNVAIVQVHNLKQKLEKVYEYCRNAEEAALREGGNNPYMNDYKELQEILKN